MNFSLQAKYFFVAVIIIGSCGIWLPFVLTLALEEEFNFRSLPVNITTFYVSLYFAGCVDLVLNYIESERNHVLIKSKFLDFIFLFLLFVGITISILWLNIKGYILFSLFLSLCATIIALRLWWVSNKGNKSFSEVIREEAREEHGQNWGNE